jgi:hypothetical protein
MFFLIILSLFGKVKVEMNHCDGWPSKGIPLKTKGYSEEGGTKEMQGELGRTVAEMKAQRGQPARSSVDEGVEEPVHTERR